MSILYPLSFKKALVKGFSLSKDEVLYKTIYNHKCLSFKNIRNKLHPVQFEQELKSTRALKNFLNKQIEKGALIRDRAPDIPEFKKSGYSVNVNEAYKDKFPYTLMSLDPLPVLKREDYIYHLILNTDPYTTYKLYPDEYHETLDKYFSQTIYFCEQLFDQVPDLLISLNEDLKIFNNLDPKILNETKKRIEKTKQFLDKQNKIKWEGLKKAGYFI